MNSAIKSAVQIKEGFRPLDRYLGSTKSFLFNLQD